MATAGIIIVIVYSEGEIQKKLLIVPHLKNRDLGLDGHQSKLLVGDSFGKQ